MSAHARAPRSRWSRALIVALKAGAGLLLLALLLSRMDLGAVHAAFARYRWPDLTLALVLFVCSWPLSTLRWRLFAPSLPFRRLFDLNLIGQFYSLVLPGQIAGEAVKAYRLARGSKDAQSLALSVAMDRLIGTIGLVALAIVGAAFAVNALPDAIRASLIAIGVALVAGLFALRFGPVRSAALAVARRLPAAATLPHSIGRLIDAWREQSSAPRLAGALLLTVLVQFLTVAILLVLSADLGIDVRAADWLWINAVVSLAVLIPISIGGIGLREGALVGCLSYLGVDPESALSLSLGVFCITLSGAGAGYLAELAAGHGERAAPDRRDVRSGNETPRGETDE